jgi:hypothetical protein
LLLYSIAAVVVVCGARMWMWIDVGVFWETEESKAHVESYMTVVQTQKTHLVQPPQQQAEEIAKKQKTHALRNKTT